MQLYATPNIEPLRGKIASSVHMNNIFVITFKPEVSAAEIAKTNVSNVTYQEGPTEKVHAGQPVKINFNPELFLPGIKFAAKQVNKNEWEVNFKEEYNIPKSAPVYNIQNTKQIQVEDNKSTAMPPMAPIPQKNITVKTSVAPQSLPVSIVTISSPIQVDPQIQKEREELAKMRKELEEKLALLDEKLGKK